MSINKCNQHGCENAPAYRFTWPGKNEAAICAPHSEKLKKITEAMGLYVQLIELEKSGEHPAVEQLRAITAHKERTE